MSLKQRRHSRLYADPTPLTQLRINLSNTNLLKLAEKPEPPVTPKRTRMQLRNLWKKAIRKSRSIEDPWEQFHIGDLPCENVIRHRYSALKRRWVKDHCQVKMEKDVSIQHCLQVKK